jgi:alpha-tubulin suppressor-like RCC1 family protein
VDDAVAIASEGSSTCVLTAGGEVLCFGEDLEIVVNYEEAPFGAPVAVGGLPGGVAEIALGYEHGCARIDSGSVYCWGGRTFGQLGIEPTGTAFRVAQLPHDAVEVALNIHEVFARSSEGEVTRVDLETGATTQPLGDGAQALKIVTCEEEIHSCILDLEGRLFCWGSNRHSQLGEIVAGDVSEPTLIDGVPTGLVDVSVREGSTIALTADGRVFLLAGPDRVPPSGEMASSDDLDPPLPPLEVTSLGDGNLAVSDGSCVLRATGDLVCLHRIDDGTSAAIDADPDVPDGTVALARRNQFTCFLGGDGAVSCIGDYSEGQLGNGVECPDTEEADCYEFDPQQTVGLESGASDLEGGNLHTCAVNGAGRTVCWGPPWGGVLGDGTFLPSTVPVEVVGLPEGLADMDVGFNSSCGVFGDDSVYCWGNHIYSDYEHGARLVHGF